MQIHLDVHASARAIKAISALSDRFPVDGANKPIRPGGWSFAGEKNERIETELVVTLDEYSVEPSALYASLGLQQEWVVGCFVT